MTQLTVRKIVPEGDRMKALMQAVKGRETKMVHMLLGAYLRRYTQQPIQLRYEMESHTAYRIYIEPDTIGLVAIPDLPSADPVNAISFHAPNTEQIFEYAGQFRQQSPISDPKRVAIEVTHWGATCSINFVPHVQRHGTQNARSIEGPQQK